MQINSTTSLNTQYITDLQNKQATTSSRFEDELTSQNEETSKTSTSSVSTVEEPQERYYNVYTYENTKGMTSDDIDEYFSERTEEERSQIKFTVNISNNFSEDDLANEAIFDEAKGKISLKSRQEFSIQMALETDNFLLGTPTLSDVLTISDAYLNAIQSGIQNPEAQGIYMNDASKARYESGNFSIIAETFTSEEATDFLSTMTQLAKDKIEESEGSQVYDDYEEAYERYNRINEDYNELVAKQEENTKFEINV